MERERECVLMRAGLFDCLAPALLKTGEDCKELLTLV